VNAYMCTCKEGYKGVNCETGMYTYNCLAILVHVVKGTMPFIV